MIRKLRLGNFKAFAETQEVPLRPLTLIYGPNSAGKSSIIQSLALVHHGIHTGELDTYHTEVGGESIDLGGFRQYVHRRDIGRLVEWTAELESAHFESRLTQQVAPAQTLALQFIIGESKTSGVSVQSCTLFADETPIVTMSARGRNRLRIDRLEQNHPIFKKVLEAIILATTTTQEVREEDYAGLTEVVDAMVPEFSIDAHRMVPRLLGGSTSEQDKAQSLLIPVSRSGRQEDLAGAARLFLPRALRNILNGIADLVAEHVGRLSYLGPLRSYPPRHFLLARPQDPNWVAGGGHAWEVVARSAEVREQVNRWLSDRSRLATPYRLKVRDYVAEDQLDRLLHASLVPWTEHIRQEFDKLREEHKDDASLLHALRGTIESLDEEAAMPGYLQAFAAMPRDTHPDLVLIDERTQTTVSHRDVGIGISQVLPVLVNAYSLSKRLVAIEQPEIHLHPALQAELGDLFIQSALGERANTFMLETHSEHLLLRIMRRMRQTAEGTLPEGFPPLRPDDVSVLFVEPDGPRSIVRQMFLNERGELVQAWPGGFFEEGLREVF